MSNFNLSRAKPNDRFVLGGGEISASPSTASASTPKGGHFSFACKAKRSMAALLSVHMVNAYMKVSILEIDRREPVARADQPCESPDCEHSEFVLS